MRVVDKRGLVDLATIIAFAAGLPFLVGVVVFCALMAQVKITDDPYKALWHNAIITGMFTLISTYLVMDFLHRFPLRRVVYERVSVAQPTPLMDAIHQAELARVTRVMDDDRRYPAETVYADPLREWIGACQASLRWQVILRLEEHKVASNSTMDGLLGRVGVQVLRKWLEDRGYGYKWHGGIKLTEKGEELVKRTAPLARMYAKETDVHTRTE